MRMDYAIALFYIFYSFIVMFFFLLSVFDKINIYINDCICAAIMEVNCTLVISL